VNLCPAAKQGNIDPNAVAIVISRQIRPFIDVSQGVADHLNDLPGLSTDIYYLDRIQETAGEEAAKKLREGAYAVFVAIGPEAAQYVWNMEFSPSANRLFAAVLNPGKNIGTPGENDCGISLNIPIDKQVQMIHEGLPAARRIGMIYDPSYNEAFFEAASQAADFLGIQLKALQVSDRKNISEVLNTNIDFLDGLWMIPDATVISETIIHYLIKACLVKKKTVIGYNRFFFDSGAALSFVFDYYQLGLQTGQMAEEMLTRGICMEEEPRFEVWLNERIFRRLEIDLPSRPPSPIKVKK
jgi:putative ABC transport system substrate-binding protein